MVRPKKYEREETDSPFKKLRLKARFSQEQLAREIGVSVSSIRRWEKGETEPTLTPLQMKNYCDAIERDLWDLPDTFVFSSDRR